MDNMASPAELAKAQQQRNDQAYADYMPKLRKWFVENVSVSDGHASFRWTRMKEANGISDIPDAQRSYLLHKVLCELRDAGWYVYRVECGLIGYSYDYIELRDTPISKEGLEWMGMRPYFDETVVADKEQ